jgi:hypothetical protein
LAREPVLVAPGERGGFIRVVGQELEEGLDPLRIELEVGRKLPQERTELRPKT